MFLPPIDFRCNIHGVCWYVSRLARFLGTGASARRVPAAVIGLSLVVLMGTAPQTAQASDTLRPPVAASLQAVQVQLAAGKPQEALQTLRDVERKVSDRSLYETYMMERLKAAASVAASDDAAATAALEAALKTEKATASERLTVLAQLAGLSLKLRNDEAAGRWAALHVQAGGEDENVRAILVRAALARGDCRTVVDQLAIIVAATERRGQIPPEAQLRASAACQAKLGQDDGYYRDLERLVRHHPTVAYWADIIARLQRRPAMAERLLLDTFRLMRHVGAMEDAEDFLSATQLAVRAALPGEALQFLKAGFDAGALGKGPASQAHRDLLARVTRDAASDRDQLAETLKQAMAGGDARRLFVAGQAAWSLGQADRGIQVMQQALAQGGLREPGDARLHLGVAMAQAGRRDEARQVLSNLPDRDGLPDLGRLWLIALR